MSRHDLERLGVVSLGVVVVLAIALVLHLGRSSADASEGTVQDWPQYGGPTGDRYSPLTQITTQNVAGLQEAWRFETGEGGL